MSAPQLLHRNPVGMRPPASDVMTASLALSNGVSESAVVKAHKLGHFEAASVDDLLHECYARVNRNMSLADWCHDSIVANGKSVGRHRSDEELLQAAIDSQQDIAASTGGFSTTSLESVASRTANIAILQGYESQEKVGRSIAMDAVVNDYKQQEIFRISAVSGELAEVAQSGEIKHISVIDEKVQVRLRTYAGMLSWSIENIRNGEAVDAWNRSGQQLGILAATTEEKILLRQLASASRVVGAPLAGEFFSTQAAPDSSRNANMISGSTSELSLTSMAQIWTLLRYQRCYGNSINQKPTHVLCTTQNEIAMAELLSSTRTVAGVSLSRQGDANFFASPSANLAQLTSSHLTDADVGFVGPEFVMLHKSEIDAPIVCAKLRGEENRMPRVETSSTRFDTLGLSARAVFRLGAALLSPRAAALSLGQ